MPKPCWEIKGCGREVGGKNSYSMGICSACLEQMGHSCWIVAGTLCGGAVQGTFAQKIKNCVLCEVYKLYNRSTGTELDDLKSKCPEECKKYHDIILEKEKK